MTEDAGLLNFQWAYRFVHALAAGGVHHACLAPGSRNTPLTLAFAEHDDITATSHIDERSCAFFGLGLAKRKGQPVALVCTSGTAGTNFYPAVVEASMSNIPLLVCTADRPPALHGLGANQTIDQQELFGNKVRWFQDVGMPEDTPAARERIRKNSQKALRELGSPSPGPVHLNFPFSKPLEPETPDRITDVLENTGHPWTPEPFTLGDIQPNEDDIDQTMDLIQQHGKGVILVGPMRFNRDFITRCLTLANATGFPILADGLSQLRFGNPDEELLCCYSSSFLPSPILKKQTTPEFILRFGRMPTTRELNDYLRAHTGAIQLAVTDDGRRHDSTKTLDILIEATPQLFTDALNQRLHKSGHQPAEQRWSEPFIRADGIAQSVMEQEMKSHRKFEGRIYPEVLSRIPPNTNLMVSNSLPVRDLDYYAPRIQPHIPIFFNRGVSGIDGITSTALGIAAAYREPMVLITGDLAFLHDTGALIAAHRYKLPLTVILVNNSGGGIFEMLPISKFGETYRTYVTTPHAVQFEPLVRAFAGKFTAIRNWRQFHHAFPEAVFSREFRVLEIHTDATESREIRRQIQSRIDDVLQEEFS